MRAMKHSHQKGSLKKIGDDFRLRYYVYVLVDKGQRKAKREAEWFNGRDYDHKKKLIDKAVADFMRQVNENNIAPKQEKRLITFAELAEKWKALVMCRFKLPSQDDAKSVINCHLNPAFGHKTLDQIGAEDIQAFVNAWKLHPKTLSKVVRQMRGMWDMAIAYEYVASNPFPRGVTGRSVLRMPTIPKPKTYNFTLQETLQIIAEIQEEKWRLLFRTAAEGGMRPGELAGMRRIDLNSRHVRIEQSIYRGKVQTPKTENAVREFPISQRLADDLRAFMESTKHESNRYGLIWTNGAGGALAMNKVLVKVLNPILEKLGIRAKLEAMGIKKCGLYAVRHMHITEMRRLGTIPLKTIQKRVGHAEGTNVTDKHYVHSDAADEMAAADVAGEWFNPVTTGTVN